jgi:sulfite reductase alpha subunit-like flavoprotein
MSSNNKIAILWGSETGTAQGLAETAELQLTAAGFSASAIDMTDIKLEQLPDYGTLLIITSTWGDGDPPSNAYDLLGALQVKKVDLSAVSFSICALGDTAYAAFCQCGKDFEVALLEQGAKKLFPLQECDLDYEEPFAQWLAGVTGILNSKKVQV